jgi:nucleoside-diphosphate kinase
MNKLLQFCLAVPFFFAGPLVASQSSNTAGCSVTIPHKIAPRQQTLALIKPDGVANKHIGDIITRLEESGFTIAAMKMIHLSKKEAEEFYRPHEGRPFYPSLVAYMTSGPIVAIVLEGSDAISHYRSLMGATDPAKAAPGTLRALYAQSLQENSVHGSDSQENAEREIHLIFSPQEILINK